MSGVGNVESKPVFAARAIQIGATQVVINALVAANYGTFGSFAYCCAYVPGTPDETPLLDAIATALARPATPAEMTVLRRLFAESHTVSLQDLRNRIDKPSDSTPTKVMPAERAARYADQAARLVGLKLTGPLEPSNALIDSVFALVEDNQLKYLPLHTLTSREQELNGEKEDTDIKEFSVKMKSGNLIGKERTQEVRADTTSDLRMRSALQRRALAFDQATLISWDIHDSWISSLFHRMEESPPVGYAPVSLDQCLRADRRLFVRMAETCRASIVAIPGAPRPLDLAMIQFMNHHDVTYLLVPMALPARQSPANRQGPYGKGDKERPAKGAGKGKGDKNGKGDRGPKGKGKGKNKSKTGAQPPPGCAAKADDGRFLCYSYNRVGGCNSSVSEGTSCDKGFHICGISGCNGNHPCYDCPNRIH